MLWLAASWGFSFYLDRFSSFDATCGALGGVIVLLRALDRRTSGVGYFSVVRSPEGAATGLVYPAVFAMAMRDGSEGSTGRRVGLAMGLGTSGLLVGPALAGLLAPLGPRVPVAVSLALAALVRAFAWRPTRTVRPARARRELRSELGLIGRLAASAAFLGLCLPIAFNKQR